MDPRRPDRADLLQLLARGREPRNDDGDVMFVYGERTQRVTRASFLRASAESVCISIGRNFRGRC